MCAPAASFFPNSRPIHQDHKNTLQSEQVPASIDAQYIDFHRVFEAHKNRVFNTALGLVQNRADAEDVAQEVFVKVFESFARFRGEAQPATWIYRITVHCAFDFLKAKKRKKRFGFVVSIFGAQQDERTASVELADFDHPGVALERKERARILFKAIDQLPEQQKAAFTLAKLEGLSYAEIAEVLQTSTASVESLMFRAKQNLQKRLREFYTL
jgi:RNA polymerase sigma factor (sigma-70 family)